MRASYFAWAVALASIVVSGCAGEVPVDLEDSGIPRRGLGESCARSEDCASTLCIQLADGRAVCTEACTSDDDCPTAEWGCVRPESFGSTVCGCEPTAAEEVCGDGLDNDCNARADDCRICAGRPVPEDDPANCGTCGNVCRADQECHEGACRCADATATECAGACVQMSSDSLNCGSCGRSCPFAQRCSSGMCACPPSVPDACGSVCTDMDTDRANCGSCGNLCVDLESCVAGDCQCPSGQELCSSRCVDTSTSVVDCGLCGRSCRTDQRCTAGSCSCTLGTECSGSCVDTTSDVANCGTCGHACAPGEYCAASTCRCASALYCGGTCMASGDPANCGACGRTCGPDTICTGSTCACPSGLLECPGGTCVDYRNDAENCGTCGRVCDPATTCSGGSCVCPVAGQTLCAGVGCVPLSTDPMNCGTCGNVCAIGQVCSAGTCRCPISGQVVCGGVCTSTTTDPLNCGACGTTCATGQTCTSRTCVCPSGTPTLCGGACTNRATDPLNCGSCGNVCRSGETCSGSACRCPTGQAWCASAGTCIDVLSDEMNCGGCGNTCPADATCMSGSCRCDTAGLSVCGASCSDLATDEAHCGSCTTSCTGSQVCITGTCTCESPMLGSPVRLTSAVNNSHFVSIASNGAIAAVAYIDARDSREQIYFQLVNADGTPAGPEQQLSSVTSGYAGYPDVVWNGTEWGVAWFESATTSVRLVRLAVDGTLVGSLAVPALDSGGATSSLTGVALRWTSAFGYTLFYSSNNWVTLRGFGPLGDTPGLPIGIISGSTSGLDVAVAPSGEMAVACQAGSTLSFQRVNADGSSTAPRVAITSAASPPTLVHDGVTWVLAWTTTSALIVGRGPSLAARTTVLTTALGRRPELTVRPGEVVVSWQSRATTSDTTYGLSSRRYTRPALDSAAIAPLDAVASTVLLTTTVHDQRIATASSPAGFWIAWPDTRWGATEVYDEAVVLPACGL